MQGGNPCFRITDMIFFNREFCPFNVACQQIADDVPVAFILCILAQTCQHRSRLRKFIVEVLGD